MTSLEENFKIVGVTSARDKILALCNAPALFFKLGPGGEDHCMTHWVTYVVSGILGEHIDKYDTKFCQHIREGLFNGPIDERRNLVYSLADPIFLDAYIAGLWGTHDKLLQLQKEYNEKARELLEVETGVPLFNFQKEYREYHERKVSVNN